MSTNLYVAYQRAAAPLPEGVRQICHPSEKLSVGDLHVGEDGAVQRRGQLGDRSNVKSIITYVPLMVLKGCVSAKTAVRGL